MSDENRIFPGVGCLYAIIATVFSLISFLPIFLYSEGQVAQAILSEAVWLAVDIVIIAALFILAKNQKQSMAYSFRDKTVRKTVGIIILTDGLMTLAIYIPIGINVISMIAQNFPDQSVLPNTITCIIPLLQIMLGVYLAIHNVGQDEEYTAQTVLGSAYIYNVIILPLTLIRELPTGISSSNAPGVYNLIRLFFAAAILIALYKLNRKHNQSFEALFEDGKIRKSAGILILITGVMLLPNLYSNIANIFFILRMAGEENHIQSNIIQLLVLLITVAGQITFGIYLLKKSKAGGGFATKIVFELIYVFTFVALAFSAVTKIVGKNLTGDDLTVYYSLWIFAIAVILFAFVKMNRKSV